MSKISNKTIKALLANSGNKCAFPGCVSPVIDRKYFLVGQLAHIEAASEGGPRYNPEISNLNRHSYDNLMFLCYPHHKEIDSKVNLSQYSVNHLKKMKQQKHE